MVAVPALWTKVFYDTLLCAVPTEYTCWHCFTKKKCSAEAAGNKKQTALLLVQITVLKLLAKTYLLVPTSTTAISGKLNTRTKPQYVALERLKTAVNNGTWKQEAAKSKWDTSTEIWLWLALLEGKRTKKGAQSVRAGGKPDFCNAQVPQSNEGTSEFLGRATADRHLAYMPGRCNTMRFYFNKTPCVTCAPLCVVSQLDLCSWSGKHDDISSFWWQQGVLLK